MKPLAHIIITGNEVLVGDTTDTNGPFLARELEDRGFLIDGITMLGDDRPRIVEALRRMAARVQVVVMTGGLGPTEDDHTRDAFAEAFNRPLFEDAPTLAWIAKRLTARGMDVGINARQALFPAGSEILRNPLGSAPGFTLTEGGTAFFTAPGVPRELEALWESAIAPRIGGLCASAAPHRAAYWTFGLRESELVELLDPFRKRHPELELGYRASLKGVQAKIRPYPEVELTPEQFAAIREEFRQALGSLVIGEGDTSLEKEINSMLRRHGLTLAVAESFTGGLVTHTLTNIPGASEFLVGSIVAYTADMKEKMLGVSRAVIEQYTVYSEECAREMARGVRGRTGADLGLATTGVAGPEAAAQDRPAGWMAFATAFPDGTVRSTTLWIPGPREFVKRLGANLALYQVFQYAKTLG